VSGEQHPQETRRLEDFPYFVFTESAIVVHVIVVE
jgi:hypothetical protein